ncbi:glycosyltransferase [Nocardia mangyaensis]|uniref:glycosyltransferase n=1 Tax=Nocardia mangyaensis TaxID=2213200 RepID=UPI0009037CF6|nr:glycosyltransferase family 2 protein [Nocardia sp.]
MTVTVVVPARGEESTLPITLPHTIAAAECVNAELVVVVPEGSDFTGLALPPGRIRWATVAVAGKYTALRRGVRASHSDYLVFLDADVLVAPSAFGYLVSALDDGADVAAGHLILSPPRPGDPALLHRWSEITFDTWHACRSAHPELRWALPGAMYGLRRNIFPAENPLIPVLDDVSVGLSAHDHGARIDYVADAQVQVASPTSYAQWRGQKLRTRGMESAATASPSRSCGAGQRPDLAPAALWWRQRRRGADARARPGAARRSDQPQRVGRWRMDTGPAELLDTGGSKCLMPRHHQGERTIRSSPPAWQRCTNSSPITAYSPTRWNWKLWATPSFPTHSNQTCAPS